MTSDEERTARLAACDYAERVLPWFEREHPDDKRPRVAIETARKYAEGACTEEEMTEAWAAAWNAWAAAWDISDTATWDAAWAAAWATEAAGWDLEDKA